MKSKKDTKQRLFEVMQMIDPSFKRKNIINESVQDNELYSKVLDKLLQVLTTTGINARKSKDMEGTPTITIEAKPEDHPIDKYMIHIDNNSGDLILSMWTPEGGEEMKRFDGMEIFKMWDMGKQNYDDINFSEVSNFIKTNI